MYGLRVAHNSISRIVRQCCDAIFEVMHCPRTTDQWKAVATEFSSRWNFHHTFGAIDGKHVAIRCHNNGGSLYFNYRGFHSIILFVIVNANYKFMWVEVGVNRSSSVPRPLTSLHIGQASSMVPYRSQQLNHFQVMTIQCHTF